jgi:hypothetical protein
MPFGFEMTFKEINCVCIRFRDDLPTGAWG